MRFEASVLRLARESRREGMFMKAYERSAFFAHTLIHEFKLSKRYIKTVNMDVIILHIFKDLTYQLFYAVCA